MERGGGRSGGGELQGEGRRHCSENGGVKSLQNLLLVRSNVIGPCSNPKIVDKYLYILLHYTVKCFFSDTGGDRGWFHSAVPPQRYCNRMVIGQSDAWSPLGGRRG